MNIMLPQSTQALIMREREKMLNGAVKLVSRMVEEVSNSMLDTSDTGQQECIDVKPEISEDNSIDKAVEKALDSRLKALLHDVDYRINLLYEVLDRAEGKPVNRVGSRDLNLATHILDGYSFTANSPSAGSVSWAGCHIVYKGQDHTIQDGNTDKKYIYWDNDTPTQFKTSDTQPELDADDVLVCINEGGHPNVLLAPGKLISGSALMNGTVGSAQLSSGAVIAGKIASGAINAASLFGSGVVNSTALASNSVTDAKIADGAVKAGKIAAGAINNSSIFGTGVVEAGAIKDGAITGSKIGAGAIGESNLNIAQHMLY
ncbi:hypothetical protein [Desulfallas thermosapovorans]|uniref:Uncharacterized protein n=1 Tax=Desulfallas thermosapovorans DSM 6562 TaxID=1121431 RepID=A0A5S4ZQF4_9FIRM|nr:hypothetical protein [Desulfallas thermosapovorans]TYO95125.1 hypothetical protein LX24_01854 [Desulfallas thermosapovorans DSM 6562]